MEPCIYLKYVLDGVLVVRARVARCTFFSAASAHRRGSCTRLAYGHEQNDMLGFHMRYEHDATMVDEFQMRKHTYPYTA